LHVESLLALGVIATLVSGLEWVGTLPWSSQRIALSLARALPAVYFYLALRKLATGSRRLPIFSDYRDSWDSLIYPLLQLAVVGVWFWGPTLAGASYSVGLRAFVERHQCRPLELYRQGFWAGYAALGGVLLLVPPSLVAATLDRRLLGLLDPTLGLRMVARAARGYARAFAVLCALTLLIFLLDTCGAAVHIALPIPLVAPLIRHLLVLAGPLGQAQALGAFVVHARPQLRRA
jgi:hypothetical protein